MVQVHEVVDNAEDKVEKRVKFCINDNMDVLIEILKRLDDRSLGVAACVCRLWCGLTRNDSLWMHLCFRHLSPPPEGVRKVVAALGGYRRLYMVCVKPVMRVRGGGELDAEWSRHEVELSLSLFCVDYYERFLLGGGRTGGDSTAAAAATATAAPSSLMFQDCGDPDPATTSLNGSLFVTMRALEEQRMIILDFLLLPVNSKHYDIPLSYGSSTKIFISLELCFFEPSNYALLCLVTLCPSLKLLVDILRCRCQTKGNFVAK